ncbi:MAG: Hsp20/alpha crystallin family protein [Dehalococcoidia bacterium]
MNFTENLSRGFRRTPGRHLCDAERWIRATRGEPPSWVQPRIWGPTGGRSGEPHPPVDAFATDDAVVLSVELPGMTAETITLTVQDDILSVAGSYPAEPGDADQRRYLAERLRGAFARRFALPCGVDPHAMTVEYADGLLTIRVPWLVNSPPQQVPITR